MKRQEVYNAWKEPKSKIEVGENFTQQVMNQICLYEQTKKHPLLNMQRFMDLVYAHPLAKAGIVTAGIIAGFIRMTLTVCVFLRT